MKRSRTPADGKESTEDPVQGTFTSSSPSIGVVTVPNVEPLKVENDQESLTPESRSAGPGRITDSTHSKSIETSTVYIHTPHQPTQRRVVTHVTIFPSPPQESSTQPSIVRRGGTSDNNQEKIVLGPVGEINSNKLPPALPPPASSACTEIEKSIDSPTSERSNASITFRNSSPPIEPVPDNHLPSIFSESAAERSEYSVSKPVSNEGVTESGGASSTTMHTETFNISALKQSKASNSGEDSTVLLAKHWGPERLVLVHKELNRSLGISIVGGKVSRQLYTRLYW